MPGGKFAKLAKLVAGSCNVAITKMEQEKKKKKVKRKSRTEVNVITKN